MAFELGKEDINALQLDDGVIITFESDKEDIVIGDGQWICRVSFMVGEKYIVLFEVCFEIDGVENIE